MAPVLQFNYTILALWCQNNKFTHKVEESEDFGEPFVPPLGLRTSAELGRSPRDEGSGRGSVELCEVGKGREDGEACLEVREGAAVPRGSAGRRDGGATMGL